MNKFSALFSKARAGYLAVGQKVGAIKVAPTQRQLQVMLFTFGVGVLAVGLSQHAQAALFSVSFGGGNDRLEDHSTNYNDVRVAEAVTAILTYIEGSFGALVMVGAGIAAILSSAFGQYRAALGCLVVAVGAFILRSIMSTFFNTHSIDEGTGFN